MINLSFDELRLIPQLRNKRDYEKKSKLDLIKALSESKQETKPKPETPKLQTPKPETKPKSKTLKPKPKPEPESEPEPKIRVITNKRKLKKLRKDFDELRHKFSIKEIDRYRKTFYVAKKKESF